MSTYKHIYAVPRDSVFTRYTAFYVEAKFNLRSNLNSMISEDQLFTVTTETNIIPEYNPVGGCNGFQCIGVLV